MNFSQWRPCWKWITSTAAVITAVAAITGGVTWAADTRYVTLVAQAEYIQMVNDEKKASEVRQLKRDIRRLELKEQAGNASPEDRAFIQFLKQDLEELQQSQ